MNLATTYLRQMQSFAHHTSYNDMGITSLLVDVFSNVLVRPGFGETLVVRKGQYPMMHGVNFVPNDTYASEMCRFQIITGPNMSGKSTYLRQVALLCIMAQMGS